MLSPDHTELLKDVWGGLLNLQSPLQHKDIFGRFCGIVVESTLSGHSHPGRHQGLRSLIESLIQSVAKLTRDFYWYSPEAKNIPNMLGGEIQGIILFCNPEGFPNHILTSVNKVLLTNSPVCSQKIGTKPRIAYRTGNTLSY